MTNVMGGLDYSKKHDVALGTGNLELEAHLSTASNKVAPSQDSSCPGEDKVGGKQEDQTEVEDEIKQDADRFELLESSLVVKLPSAHESINRPEDGGRDDIEEEQDGFKTPTGEEHRIPVVPECPPAPRKRGWQPNYCLGRRVSRRISDDQVHDLLIRRRFHPPNPLSDDSDDDRPDNNLEGESADNYSLNEL